MDRERAQRAFALGIANRVFAELGKTFADPNVVFSLLVRQLGGSNVLVGLLSTLRYAGWFLPQLVVAHRIQHRPLRGRTYCTAELSRCAGYAVLVILLLTIADRAILLPLFFAVFAVSYLGHGVGSVPWFDVIGRVIPPAERGAFFARSNLIAGLLGFGAGFAVRALLGSVGEPPLSRYALLILLAIALFALGVLTFARIREPAGPIPEARATFQQSIRSIPSLFRANAPYRRLVGVIVLTDAARRVTDPFYILFATEVLGVPVSYAGLYLSTLVTSKVVANLLWERLSLRLGSHRVLQWSAVASLAVPLAALLFAILRSHLGPSSGLAFASIFALIGLRDSGKYIGKRTVFLDHVAEEDWPIHWGLLNTLLGFVSLLPILAGTMIDGFGYGLTFGTVSLVALAGLWMSLRIPAVAGAKP
jgi:hypothetical protein